MTLTYTRTGLPDTAHGIDVLLEVARSNLPILVVERLLGSSLAYAVAAYRSGSTGNPIDHTDTAGAE